jgi:hypothetical protein
MKCPFYEEAGVSYCKAFKKKIIIPSRSDKEKHCTSKDYLKCSAYLEGIAKRRK